MTLTATSKYGTGFNPRYHTCPLDKAYIPLHTIDVPRVIQLMQCTNKHLDLLGLNVDLNQVVLNITAVPGAGNLLGNLLCSVAGLLDGSGINGLANLLNRLLGL